MVASDLYVVDERAVADAILARTAVRQAVAVAELRAEQRVRRIRSFRRTREARSFRLTHGPLSAGRHG
jgi:hypothetical protein